MPKEARVELADVAAFYDDSSRAAWRALQDTTNHNLLGYRAAEPWPSWMRGTGDYYREAALIWLDADTLIREAHRRAEVAGRFRQGLLYGRGRRLDAHAYTFDDVVAALNAVHPTTGRPSCAAGWTPSDRTPRRPARRHRPRRLPPDLCRRADRRPRKADDRHWGNDFQYSLGFTLSAPANGIGGVQLGRSGLRRRASAPAGTCRRRRPCRLARGPARRRHRRQDRRTAHRLVVRNGERVPHPVVRPTTAACATRAWNGSRARRDRLADILTARRR